MHHDRDWSNYNKQLVNRGKIDFWVNPKIFKKWQARKEKKNGHPFVYNDELIKTMTFIRFKFSLSLRETEGFFQSLIQLINPHIQIPCYTQLCRRMKTLYLPQELMDKKHVTDIVLDTTGLKIFGEGEWRAEKYGGKKRWKKLHLALDLDSGKIILAEATHEHVHDTTYLEKALKKSNKRKGKVLIDGIADNRKCYEMAKKYRKKLLTPPKKGAVLRKETGYEERNDAIKIIRGLGGDREAKTIWGKLVGYNQRVLVESMISRWKRLFGTALKSRTENRINREIHAKAWMINQMIDARMV